MRRDVAGVDAPLVLGRCGRTATFRRGSVSRRLGRGGPRRAHHRRWRARGHRDCDAALGAAGSSARRSGLSVRCSSSLGTTSAALLIFGPVRPRLRSLEDAARKVGAGDLTARAREDGGDEVAALARAFNQMTARSPAARGAAAGRGSHAAAAPGRRLARADDAADRHARVSRNARHSTRHLSTPKRASGISPIIRRRDAAHGAHRRRSAGSVPPRRRRRIN